MPTLATLAALVLGEVLHPLDIAMKARAQQRFSESAVDTSDSKAGGETHPMGYIDDVGAATPHVDVIFFTEGFNHLGRLFGIYLNPSKTRILISTSGTCSLSSIEKEYGSDIAGHLYKAISLYSPDATPLSTIVADLPKRERTYEALVVSAIHPKIAQCSADGSPLNEASFSLPMADGGHR